MRRIRNSINNFSVGDILLVYSRTNGCREDMEIVRIVKNEYGLQCMRIATEWSYYFKDGYIVYKKPFTGKHYWENVLSTPNFWTSDGLDGGATWVYRLTEDEIVQHIVLEDI